MRKHKLSKLQKNLKRFGKEFIILQINTITSRNLKLSIQCMQLGYVQDG